jgi:hypothetical protein
MKLFKRVEKLVGPALRKVRVKGDYGEMLVEYDKEGNFTSTIYDGYYGGYNEDFEEDVLGAMSRHAEAVDPSGELFHKDPVREQQLMELFQSLPSRSLDQKKSDPCQEVKLLPEEKEYTKSVKLLSSLLEESQRQLALLSNKRLPTDTKVCQSMGGPKSIQELNLIPSSTSQETCSTTTRILVLHFTRKQEKFYNRIIRTREFQNLLKAPPVPVSQLMHLLAEYIFTSPNLSNVNPLQGFLGLLSRRLTENL